MHRCDPYNIKMFFNILLNLAAENIKYPVKIGKILEAIVIEGLRIKDILKVTPWNLLLC